MVAQNDGHTLKPCNWSPKFDRSATSIALPILANRSGVNLFSPSVIRGVLLIDLYQLLVRQMVAVVDTAAPNRPDTLDFGRHRMGRLGLDRFLVIYQTGLLPVQVPALDA